MANPICLTGCASDLPPVKFNKCDPKIVSSEIKRIIIGKAITAPITDPSDPDEWVGRMSETEIVGDDYLRPLTVIGSKSAPERITKAVSGGRTRTITKNHSIQVTIDEMEVENHAFLRQLECGNATVRFWYETSGNLLFGGNEGIEAEFVLDMVLESGEDAHMIYQGTLTWKNKFTEEYIVSPIAS